MNNENTSNSSKGDFAPEPRVYELGYLVMPSVDEGDLTSQRDALVALITRFNGIVIDEGQPVLIDLAYEMEKLINNKKHTFSQAYFGWIKFDVSPTEVEALTKETEAVETLLRSILVKTVRENTLTSDQPFRVAKASRAEGTDTEDIDVNSEDESVEESDDLTKIEGIGPVIAEALVDAGIVSYADLASAQEEEIQEAIKDVRGAHNSSTWAQQAQLAADDKWDELSDLQDSLDGGVEKA